MNSTGSTWASVISFDVQHRTGARRAPVTGLIEREMRKLALLMLFCCTTVATNSTYQEPADFIAETFRGASPPPKLLWITAELKPAIKQIMGHDLAAMRLRYWGEPGRSAWILEEIGKEKPITVGLVVADGKLERI